MSKLFSRLAFGLCVALVLGVCAISHAVIIPYYAPFTPGTTAEYSPGAAGDYLSRSDLYGYPSNDLLGATVGQGGGTNGLGVTRIGLGELVTPQTGATYGSQNNHGFTVNRLTLPVGGGTGSPEITLSIIPGFLGDSANANAPLPPNSGLGTAVWNPGAPVYTNTFTFAVGANAYLMTLDLLEAFLAGGNPAPPVMALDQSYLVQFEWDLPPVDADNTVNSFVWYRGGNVDPGGQVMIRRDLTGFKTFAAAPFGAGAPRTQALAINVPEPGTLVLIGLALPALIVAGRRKLRG